MTRPIISGLLGLVLAALISLIYINRPSDNPRFNPSGTAAYLPTSQDSFEDYLAQNRTRIRQALERFYYAEEDEPFGPDYSLEQVLEMRSPFQYLPAEGCEEEITGQSIGIGRATQIVSEAGKGQGKGFLLVHGLTDSPYLLRSVAGYLQEQFPCALIRSLLSPGHSTVPGDLLNVTLEDWRTTFAWGIESFANEVDDLTVVGYSNGSALAVSYLNDYPEQDAVASLVLISPGLEAADDRAYLAPYFKFVRPWIYQRDDRDAVKYESFPTNAAAEFYKLTRLATAADAPLIIIPVMMVVSGDDTTTDANVAVDLFCNRMSSPDKELIWYQSSSTQSALTDSCSEVRVERVGTASAIDADSADNSDQRLISFSHISLTTPPDNAHYGLDGRYPVCLSYEDDAARYNQCMMDHAGTVYAENTFLDESGEYNGMLVRRTSFNPLFDDMMQQVTCFIDESCE